MTRRTARLASGAWLWAAFWLIGAGPAGTEARERSTVPPRALTIVRHLAIQHNGRNKPFDGFARETLRHLTGSPRHGAQDPVETVLDILAQPEGWQAEPLIALPFIPLREALGLGPKTSHVSYNQLIETRALMRRLPAIVEKQRRDEKLTMLEQETMDAFDRFVTESHLLEHKLALVPPPTALTREWLPILAPAGHPPERQQALRDAWNGFLGAWRAGEAGAIEAAARTLSDALRSANPSAYPSRWRLRLEVFYNLARPFQVAMLLYGIAALGLFAGLASARRQAAKAAAVGMRVCWAAVLLHAAGIAVRVVLGGRPPVSNFYETMLWLPFVGVALALVFERIYRARYFALAAAILAAVTLALADQVPLDSSIAPVVAVLRSTLWLTIHVLTIVASYGALALATVLAHVYGALFLSRRGRHPALASLDLFLYRAIQVGVVLLAGGIMLGAVWANASWGRYWGWDPKETWALITLLWFLAVLHGRFAGWLRGVGVALSTIGGFFLLLMTYYGVSFYLVGLHSYAGGHAKPLPVLLVAYLIAEAAFLLLVGLSALRRQPA